MLTPFQFVETHIATVGWGAVLSLVGWLWRMSIKLTLQFSQTQAATSKALVQIDTMATTCFPTMQKALKDLNEKQESANGKSDKTIEILNEISTGIAVLVDRTPRTRGSE
jgi:hypothetical protein